MTPDCSPSSTGPILVRLVGTVMKIRTHVAVISAKQHHEAHVTWRPDQPGKFRGILALRVNGRFPARVSVVGEALLRCGGGAKAKRGDGRAFGKQVKKGPSVGTSGGDVVPSRRASLAREEPRGLARSAPVGGALSACLERRYHVIR